MMRFLLVLLTRLRPRRRHKLRQLLRQCPLLLLRLRLRLKSPLLLQLRPQHLCLHILRRGTAAQQREDMHRSRSAVMQRLRLFPLNSRRRSRPTRPPQPRLLLLHLLLLLLPLHMLLPRPRLRLLPRHQCTFRPSQRRWLLRQPVPLRPLRCTTLKISPVDSVPARLRRPRTPRVVSGLVNLAPPAIRLPFHGMVAEVVVEQARAMAPVVPAVVAVAGSAAKPSRATRLLFGMMA